MYKSTKKYDHNAGFSCCFRQWKADSHCNKLHGYALAFKFTFVANELDKRMWVVDFGGLKSLKGMLEDNFDHTTLVAEDDPHLEWYKQGEKLGLLDLRMVPATGCEAVAKMVFEVTQQWLKDAGFAPRVMLEEVEVSEHSGNSAIYSAWTVNNYWEQ